MKWVNTESVEYKNTRGRVQRLVGRWRLIPRVRYTNFRKEYSLPKNDRAFRGWFSVDRYWGGRIINVSVRHFQLSFDFRKSAWADFRAIGNENERNCCVERMC